MTKDQGSRGATYGVVKSRGRKKKKKERKKKHGGRQLIAVRINSLDVFIWWRSGKGWGAINCQGLNSRFYESIRKNKQTPLCSSPIYLFPSVCRWLFQRSDDIYIFISGCSLARRRFYGKFYGEYYIEEG